MKIEIKIKTLAWCALIIFLLVFALGMFGIRITYAPERSIDWTTTAAIGTIFGAFATVGVGIAAVYIAKQGNEQIKKMDEIARKERLMEEMRRAVDDVNHMLGLGFFNEKYMEIKKMDIEDAKEFLLSQLNLCFTNFMSKDKIFISKNIVSADDPYSKTVLDYNNRIQVSVSSEEHRTLLILTKALLDFYEKEFSSFLSQGEKYLRDAEAKIFGK